MAAPLTWNQIERRQAQAVRFVRDVKGDADRAAEIEAESLRDYAERRGFAIANPNERRLYMAKTRAQLERDNVDLNDENQQLHDELEDLKDGIAGLLGEEEEEEEEENDDNPESE